MKKFLNFNHIRGDIFGGVTAGIVALPLALAFGSQTPLGAEAGLYGAIAIGFFAALLGGTETQVSGPTGPMTVVSIGVILSAMAMAGSSGINDVTLGIIIATFFVAGLIELLFGIIGIGKYIKYIPYPVVSGFMSGIGVIILVLQIFDFFGYAGTDAPKNIVGIITGVGLALANINWVAVTVAMATIAIIYLFPRVTKAVPSTLVALIVVSAAAYFMKLDIPIIGDIPKGLPDLKVDTILAVDFTDTKILFFILKYGLILAALGAIDSLLTSLVADNLTKTKHDSNRELMGQGIGNMAAAMIGGLPGAGATMRTVVNINSGGITRISGGIHGLFLLGVLLGLGVFVGVIPKAVLAGILITVGIGIVDYKGLRDIAKVPRADAVIMIVVLVMTVFVDLLQAVGVGMILASILFMKKISDVVEDQSVVESLHNHIAAKEPAWADEIELPEHIKEKVFIKHLNGPMFFGFTMRFQELVQEIPNIEEVIFRMERVPYMDQSGLYAFEEALSVLKKKNIDVIVTGLQKQPRELMDKSGIIPPLLPEENIHPNFKSCMKVLYERFPARQKIRDEKNSAK